MDPNPNDAVSKPDIDAVRFGSLKLYCYLKSKNVFTELHADSQMGHGIETVPPDDLGTGYSTEDSVYTYIGGRMATFFQAILYNRYHPGFLTILKTKRSYFVHIGVHTEN